MHASATGVLATVDMKRLASHEAGALQVKHGIGNLLCFAHPADWMQFVQEVMRFLRMHGRLDDPRCHRVHANALLGVFDSQRTRYRVETALGEPGQPRGHAGNGLLHYSGSYLDNLSDPNRRVSASTSLDLLLSYRTAKGDRWSDDLELSLRGSNVFNANPPRVNNMWGYDVPNWQPIGRVFVLAAKKNW